MKRIHLKREVLKQGGLSLGTLKIFIGVKSIKHVNNEEGS